MMTFGRTFRTTLFGTSHGPEVGVVVDGIRRGTVVDVAQLQTDLDRRRPVGRRLATRRQEADRLVVDAGIEDGRATGGSIRAHVANEDVDRAPYDAMRATPRPGHADYPARVRFGPQADLSGGGIFSGRMTVGLVIAGGIARGLLDPIGVRAVAFTTSIGSVTAPPLGDEPFDAIESRCRTNEAGCADAPTSKKMEAAIADARRAGDSLGGIIECRAAGVPVGLGEPFFDSIESEVAHLAFSVPAVKAIEFGDGFASARARGTAHNDAFYWDGERVRTLTNHAGGILGGLATGEPIVFRVAVKPTASIATEQTTVNLDTHATVRLVVKGRHDPCIVPRAVVVVESIARVALADLALSGVFIP
ncbi:MAG: chorismate synthase [Thermoplasmata archaeon]